MPKVAFHLVLVAKTSRKRNQWVIALQENIDYAKKFQLNSAIKEPDSRIEVPLDNDMIYYEGNLDESINIDDGEDDDSDNESECEDIVDNNVLPTSFATSQKMVPKTSHNESTETKR